jgi:serine/threonine-protein kinase
MAAPRSTLPSRYAVQDLVAHGGMGDVYRAADERLGRVVAIKVLAERYARQDEFRKRFLREARTAATLTGEPNVVAIYDVGETTDAVPFIVMEHVPDGTVADRLAAGPVPTELAMRWLAQAAAALDSAHARGIVHRDVKPANLLVADDGSLRVSDFGIARAAGEDTLTAAGTVLGSTGYMAPEQARGEPSTPATDRYALACVAFELLTGRRPFARDAVAAEAAAHAYESPPLVGDLAPLPKALDAVFERGLAKRPSDRPASCSALVADLREALAQGATRTVPVAVPTRPTEPRIVRHRSQRSRAGLLGGAIALLVAGVGLAWALTSLGGDGGVATVVVTRTSQGQTVERTVTESDTVVVTEGADAGQDGEGEAEPVAGESGAELNDRGYRLLQQGDVRGALPVLESAVSRLQGSSSLAEAYASYNLAVARFGVGRCDGVAALLDRSQHVKGNRKEIDRLRKQVDRRWRGVED